MEKKKLIQKVRFQDEEKNCRNIPAQLLKLSCHSSKTRGEASGDLSYLPVPLLKRIQTPRTAQSGMAGLRWCL